MPLAASLRSAVTARSRSSRGCARSPITSCASRTRALPAASGRSLSMTYRRSLFARSMSAKGPTPVANWSTTKRISSPETSSGSKPSSEADQSRSRRERLSRNAGLRGQFGRFDIERTDVRLSEHIVPKKSSQETQGRKDNTASEERQASYRRTPVAAKHARPQRAASFRL